MLDAIEIAEELPMRWAARPSGGGRRGRGPQHRPLVLRGAGPVSPRATELPNAGRALQVLGSHESHIGAVVLTPILDIRARSPELEGSADMLVDLCTRDPVDSRHVLSQLVHVDAAFLNCNCTSPANVHARRARTAQRTQAQESLYVLRIIIDPHFVYVEWPSQSLVRSSSTCVTAIGRPFDGLESQLAPRSLFEPL